MKLKIRRPLGLIILAYIILIFGGLFFLASLAILVIFAFTGFMAIGYLTEILAIFYSLFIFALGIGLLKMKRWVVSGFTVLFAISLTIFLIRFFGGNIESVKNLIINIAVLVVEFLILIKLKFDLRYSK